MSIYTKAGTAINDMVNTLIDNHYGELAECQIRIGVLFAHPRAPMKPALTTNGVPVLSTIRKINLKDRVAGLPDAQIILDGPYWNDPNTTNDNQLELLDSQLYRLELKRDKTRAIKTDDAQRPIITLKRYDYFIAGHDSIIRRYGNNSLALRAIADLSLHAHTLPIPTMITEVAQ